MLYRLLADAVLLFHLAFILFVVLGAVLAACFRWMPLLHLPAAAWGCMSSWRGSSSLQRSKKRNGALPRRTGPC